MPYADADGVKLYYEEAGTGRPLIFVHEFAGDHRSWEGQIRHFSRRYRCITYNARGYPPSDVPEDVAQYSQDIAADDIAHVMRHLGLKEAHVVGLSMGGFATLHFGLRHPDMALSLVVAGCGYGADKETRAQFQADADALAKRFETEPETVAETYAKGPYRVQFMNKDPRGFAEFARQFAEHSPLGSANTLRGCQRNRPSLYDLEDRLKSLVVPMLILTGDEDEPCIMPDLFLKRTIPTSALAMLPRSGHPINLEEPQLFNTLVEDFLHTVELCRWEERDPRSIASSALMPLDK